MNTQKQPGILPILFFTDLWERFGFFMTQGLFVLYLTSNVFHFSDSKSYSILGTFSAIAMMTPILGGYLATRFLDYQPAITFGAVLLIFGYALLALPNESFFYIALAIIALGIGFFKPSITSFLGDFYAKKDPLREKGFTILYVGLNIGIVLSTSISGFVVRYAGWHIPFLLASMGLLISMLIFVLGIYYLKKTGKFHRINASVASKDSLVIHCIYISTIFLIYILYEIIKHRTLADTFMLGAGSIIFIGIFFYAWRYKTPIRNKLLACLLLILLSIGFFAIFMQVIFSMSLFTERAVNRQFFSLHLPTPFFLGLESIFLIIFGPFFANLWQRLSIKNKNMSIPAKFTLAFFILSIVFFIQYVGIKNASIGGLVSMWFIVVANLFLAISELLLSPTGYMMVTVLVPQELIGLMMGVWLIAGGFGEKLASSIADYAAIPKHIHQISQIDHIYGHAFLLYTALSLIGSFIFLFFIPVLKKMIEKN